MGNRKGIDETSLDQNVNELEFELSRMESGDSVTKLFISLCASYLYENLVDGCLFLRLGKVSN